MFAGSGDGSPGPSDLNPAKFYQNMINQQILAQLNIGKRLDSMEKNSLQSTHKKSDDSSIVKKPQRGVKAHVACNRDQITCMASPSTPSVCQLQQPDHLRQEANKQEEV